MSEVFSDYAKYYDLLYKDKNYAGEAAYIHGLIQKYKAGARTILNLGCGTGKHDEYLEKFGYQITGVDLSETMLIEARKRQIHSRLEFFHGDVRTINLGKKFDVVISLFHVMSYQATDEDVASAFLTAYRHLNPEGVFIFDFWNGEGVLKDPPVVRVKRLEDDTLKIVRIAEPVLRKDCHLIDVHYQIITIDKASGYSKELREVHLMRYFFIKELEQFLVRAGLVSRDTFQWMSSRPLEFGWYGLTVATAKNKLPSSRLI